MEYDAKAFLAALFKEMDDWWYICRAILDEMDRGKEMREKIYEELYSFQDGAILLMMDAVENDDFFMMEKLTGNDYSRFYAEEEGHAEYEEEIHIKDYLNSLSCEELKEKDARDAELWERCKKDNDVGWSEWCDQRIKEMENELIDMDNDVISLMIKDDKAEENTDDDSFDTTYATESTDSTSVSVKHNTNNYELN